MQILKRFKSIKSDIVWLTAFIYSIIVITAYSCIYSWFNIFILPDNNNIVNLDAYWYYTIKEFGYVYVPSIGNNLAFFPLFPLFWKITGLSPILISILNYLIFIGSLSALFRNEKLNHQILLILFSFPSFIFFAVPYSESLFFLFSTCILLGYKKQNNLLINIGLFGASLVRSVCIIFIPAIIICEVLNIDSTKTKKDRSLLIMFRLSSSIIGLLLAMLYVYCKTNTWFYFIEIQKYWNRHWIIPQFPLTTITPERILGIDGIAFMFGAIGIWLFFKNFINIIKTYFKASTIFNLTMAQPVLFSVLYIVGMTLLDVCFTYNTNGGTNIWSLNRHVICTPFAVLFLVFIYNDFKPVVLELITLILMLTFGAFLTGIYHYVSWEVLFTYISFFLFFFVSKYYPKIANYFCIYYVLAVFYQMKFYSDYLLGQWLG